MWFRIIKQGKILTLPKTKLRIKKPEKVEEERTCKDKLLRLNEKLKTEKSILETIHNIWQQEDYEHTEKWDIEIDGRFKTHRNYSIRPSKENPAPKHYQLGATEGIWYVNNKKIENMPEDVCCAALDLLNKATVQSSPKGYPQRTSKKISGWEIKVAYNTNEFLETIYVEHKRTTSALRLKVDHVEYEKESLGEIMTHFTIGWAVTAPSDWIEEYSVDWR